MALATTIRVSLSATQTKTADLESASSAISDAFVATFSDGAGANQADRIWKDTRTLAASAEESIDLAGAWTDIYGAAVILARVKAIFLKASPSNTNNVILTSGDTSGVPQFLDAVVRPGGAVLWVSPDAAGVAVTGGSADLLNIANSAGSSGVTYTLFVLGAST